jgi:hypothetical protein
MRSTLVTGVTARVHPRDESEASQSFVASGAAGPYARPSGQAAIFFFDEDFLPDFETLTSLRFLTV